MQITASSTEITKVGAPAFREETPGPDYTGGNQTRIGVSMLLGCCAGMFLQICSGEGKSRALLDLTRECSGILSKAPAPTMC